METPKTDAGEGIESFRWRVRLSDKAPEKLWGVFAVAALAGAAGWFLFRSPLMMLIGFAIILASSAEYWLGTQYKVDEKGASARTGFSLVSIDWADVKRFVRDEKGIRLSPLEKPGTLDAFRGVYLRYGDGNRDQVEGAVLTFGGVRTTLDGRADGRSDGIADRQDSDGDLSSQAPDSGDHRPGDE
jgi:hypothetical protein